MYRILIVEDESAIAEGIRANLSSWGMEGIIVSDFRRIVEEFNAHQPHLVLMDISLPYMDGYHWCRELRRKSTVPIVFVSSASDNMNIVMAMNMGGDDFIAKPFDNTVLLAKIHALLRRSYDFAAGAPRLEHRDAVLNTGDNTLTYRGQSIPLTKNEYRILLCLLENKCHVVSREKLMERLWETDQFVDDNTLTVNVNRLRRKLEGAGLESFITTRFGVGYIVE